MIKICNKYKNTLKFIEINNLMESDLITILSLEKLLTYISIPFSHLNDNIILQFVKEFPQLQYLGLEMCQGITPGFDINL